MAETQKGQPRSVRGDELGRNGTARAWLRTLAAKANFDKRTPESKPIPPEARRARAGSVFDVAQTDWLDDLQERQRRSRALSDFDRAVEPPRRGSQ